MTGLALESSDMDIAVTGLQINDRFKMIDDLHIPEICGQIRHTVVHIKEDPKHT